MSGSATATFNGGMSLTSGSFTTDNTAAVTVNSTFASSNSTLSFNNNSSFNPSSVANISGGTVTVNDNSKLDPGGTLTVGTGSDLTIGDGTGSAGVSASNLNVTGNSFVGIASGTNTLTLSSGKFKNDHGNASYSAISTVSITHGAATLSIYPNPATGHTFFVTAPNSSPLVVSIFTLTGQLIERTTVQGQTQYPIQLPSQLLPGTAVVVQTIQAEENRSFPLLLR